jgi:hypothetical protein
MGPYAEYTPPTIQRLHSPNSYRTPWPTDRHAHHTPWPPTSQPCLSLITQRQRDAPTVNRAAETDSATNSTITPTVPISALAPPSRVPSSGKVTSIQRHLTESGSQVNCQNRRGSS